MFSCKFSGVPSPFSRHLLKSVFPGMASWLYREMGDLIISVYVVTGV